MGEGGQKIQKLNDLVLGWPEISYIQYYKKGEKNRVIN